MHETDSPEDPRIGNTSVHAVPAGEVRLGTWMPVPALCPLWPRVSSTPTAGKGSSSWHFKVVDGPRGDEPDGVG